MKKLILVLVMFIMMNTVVNVANPYTTVAEDFEQRKRLELPSIIGLAESEIEKIQLEKKIQELDEMREELRRQKEEQERKRLEEEKRQKEKLERERKEKERLERERKQKEANRGSSRNLYTVTCYDLGVQSTGKPIGHKAYGLTASGVDLTGHTWETARAVAVDPSKIPLGTKLKITFTDEKYHKYNGIYTAVDTGGAIKGNKIDFFKGDFNQNETHPSVWEFGRTKAVVEILK